MASWRAGCTDRRFRAAAGSWSPTTRNIHQELKRPGVTLQLLWEEYSRSNALAYKYTSFCIKYRAWVAAQARSMRQVRVAGERAFIDYAGQTVPIIDAD
jgi:transposase